MLLSLHSPAVHLSNVFFVLSLSLFLPPLCFSLYPWFCIRMLALYYLSRCVSVCTHCNGDSSRSLTEMSRQEKGSEALKVHCWSQVMHATTRTHIHTNFTGLFFTLSITAPSSLHVLSLFYHFSSSVKLMSVSH